MCVRHTRQKKSAAPYRIAADKLEETVLSLLQQHISNILELKRILSFIGTVPFQQIDLKKLEERRAKKEAEAERCAELRTTLYEDMKDGMISKEDYRELHAAYEATEERMPGLPSVRLTWKWKRCLRGKMTAPHGWIISRNTRISGGLTALWRFR